MNPGDLFRSLIDPLIAWVRAWLVARGVAAVGINSAIELIDVVTVALVATAVVPVAARLYGSGGEPSARAASASVSVLRLVATIAAALLLWWIFLHPAPTLADLFTRADHLAFSALAGGALAGAKPVIRAWALALLSLGFLWLYSGTVAPLVVLAAIVVGYSSLKPRNGGRPRAVVLACVAVAVYGVAFTLHRLGFLFHGLQTFGLFSLIFLRQISAAVAMATTARPAFGSYLCYLTFYLGGFGPIGGPEVYADFARRNFRATLHYDPRTAARKMFWGVLQVWAARRLPISVGDVMASSTPFAAWGSSLLLFARGALYAMGVWSTIEAAALFHGFRLHPNFRGLLTRRNPSELWWAWRGTFTNWLVRHVYGPLGAAQRHQSLNIFAAFGVSWLWHVVGLPFLISDLRPLQLLPLTLWALVNATAVAGHIQAQKHGLRLLPAATPEKVRRMIHTLLTACLATFSITFLSFQGKHIDAFVPFLRLLLGLPW